MKTSFRQFIIDMNRKHKFSRRLISVLCVLSILVSVSVSLLLTMPGLTVSGDPRASSSIVELLTDNPTHNGWIDYFQIGNGSYNTEFVGSVWTDKSVFTKYTTSKNQQIVPTGENNMLGVLSAIGSSMAITGRIYTPTDVMFILDMSSSMYKNSSTRDTTTVKIMVDSVNKSIATLLSLNDYNRIGVTVYWGGGNVLENTQSNEDHGYVLLPLDRYTPSSNADYPYLKMNTSGGKLTSVKVTSGVKHSNGDNAAINGHDTPKDVAAGTYTQLGILHAMNEFLEADELEVKIDEMDTTVYRQPIFVLMSDGEPTAGTTNFTNVNATAQFGNNQIASRSPNATDFVTQLTAAYAKAEVDAYYPVEPLFYSLGLKMTTMTLNVMDPENHSTATINQYWKELVDNGKTSVTAQLYKSDWSDYKTDGKGGHYHDFDVSYVTMRDNKTQFPSNVNQRVYVDQYFSAETDADLTVAFEAIVDEIILRSIYTPTQSLPERVNNTGKISFVDHIGEYMTVKDIKGVLMGGILHTGAAFSKTLVREGESTLGTFGEATEFGMTFWNNIMDQLDLYSLGAVGPNGEESGREVPAVAELDKLIRAAFDAGQISYTDDENYSNYIGWYADDNDQYLGFWDGSDTVDTTDLVDPASQPTQRIKTYFFQSRISGDDNQTYNTDMMYITVWVKEDMATGQETVIFSVPAALLPTLKYFVKLDPTGTLEEFYLGSIHGDTVFNDDGTIKVRPIRLVYEVGLEDGITADTLLEKVDASYLSVEQNVNEDEGRVYFYANEWERDQSTGYFKENTYSYFSPSRFNDRYFYVEDVPILYLDPTDGKYYDCMASQFTTLEHADDLYTIHAKYVREGDRVYKDYYYMPVGDYVIDAVNEAHSVNEKGQWYVPAGVEHSLKINEVERFDRKKDNNITSTLIYRNKPILDRTNLETTGTFILAATLGNNGRIAIEPEGQTLQKLLVYGGSPMLAETAQTFRFLLHEGEALDLQTYANGAAVIDALNGKQFTIIDLTVQAGQSLSNKVELKDLKQYTWSENDNDWAVKDAQQYPSWDCLYTHTYTVVELATNEDYGLVDIGGSKTGFLTFQYGVYPAGEEDHTIVASNEFAPWNIELTKLDSQQNATLLADAVFGLYSLNQGDQLKAEEVPAEYKDLATYSYNEQTWYLASVQTTDANGQITWEKLIRNQYMVLELQAPPGYMIAADRNVKLVSRSLAAPDETTSTLTARIAVVNTPGAELPSTGGSGPFVYMFIGATLMLASAALMFVYHTRRKEERVS